MFIPYAKHVITQETIEAVVEVMNEGWIGLGKRGIRLEKKLAKWFDREDGVMVNSGSSANLLAIATLMSPNTPEKYRLYKGDRVIVPVCGFPTTINPIIQHGLIPVFIGVDVGTYNLNVEDLVSALDHNPRAIMFAHALGNPASMNEIIPICKANNLVIIEDCCDAIGALHDGKKVGSFGHIATLSMYSAHHVAAGSAGLFTGEPELVIIARSMRDWGRDCTCYGADSQLKNGMCGNRFSDWLGLGVDIDHKYVYGEIGYCLLPTEIQAAIGLHEENLLEEYIERRNYNFNWLYKVFSKYKDKFYLPVVEPQATPSWFVFPITVRSNANFKREDIVRHFEENGIQTRPYFAGNILRHPAYKTIRDYIVCADLEIADYITMNTFFIGVHQHIGGNELDYIEKTLSAFMEKYTL